MQSLFHTLYFEATRNCNYNCKFCSTKSNTAERHLDMSFESIIDRIFKPAKKIGTNSIAFSGGEFLLREDAFLLLQVANDMGFAISIITNGSFLSRKTITKLKDILGDNLLISLGINSFDEKNIKTRNIEYLKSLKLISLLESYNININISVTIGKFNANSFESTINQINSLKLPYNRIPFSPRNFDCNHLMFDKETMKNKIHPALLKHYRGYVSYVPFFLDEETYFKHTEQNRNISTVPTNPSIGCWVGSFYAINPEGEVAPCPLLLDNITGGNVLKTELKDILFKSELFSKIVNRTNLKGKCKDCKYNYTCGGCRTMAYYQTGDIFGEDPTCFIDELSEKELKEMEEATIKGFKNYNRMVKFNNHNYHS